MARVAFKGQPGAAHELGLNGARKQSFSGRLEQAQQFYRALLADPALVARMGVFGLSAAKLQAGQTALGAVAAANLVQESERGDAQNATKARDAALDALDNWMGDFIAIARVALDDQPQLLEKLGVLIPS